MQGTLGFYIKVLYEEFSAYAAARLREAGLSFGQLPFLVFIGKEPGCTPSQVTAQLHMDWGYSQRSIARLTEEGFVRKEKKTPGARMCQLFLTERGQAAFSEARQVFTSWDSEILGDQDPEEVRQILDTLQKLVNKVEARENR